MFNTVNQINREVIRRNKDNIYSRVFYRRISPFITYFFIKLGISANATTWLSVCFALAGSFLLSFNQFYITLIGFLFLQIWYLLDHVDGEIARFTKTATKEGIYLDVVTHSLVHPIIYFCFGLDVVNGIPSLLSLPLFDTPVNYRRIMLFLSFIAGLSTLLIDLSSSMRYQVLVCTSKIKKVSQQYCEITLRLRNSHPMDDQKFRYKAWRFLWNIVCVPGSILILTAGSLLGINRYLIPLYAAVLFPLAIYAILLRMKSRIDTLY